jgi:hypothetical protein
MEVRDWFIIFHVNAAGIAATVFLYKYPVTANFGIWATTLATIVGCYHWFVIRDTKVADAK